MKLSLVGAGPGHPDMITLQAIKTMQQAKVVMYDALANPALLDYATQAHEKIYVGKRLGSHHLSQQEINQLIIEKCKQYGHVVRLKGGDPFVFGRASEEIEAATAADIAVDIIPGISSAVAVPALQGIPLTLRGKAESFWVITGTTQTGELSSDIALAAQSTATVVILMAISKLQAIAEIFSQHGKRHLPAAIIMSGSTPQEKMVTGTVHDIVMRAENAGIANPAIVIIGDVVTARHHLNTSNTSQTAASPPPSAL